MLVFDHVSHAFEDREVLHDINLRIPKGSIFVLLGTSGSGKTTLLRMINRLITPSKGKVTWKGEDIQSFEPLAWRRQTGYVIQQMGLFPHYTVSQNIQLVPSLLHWPIEKRTKRVEELLNWLKLDPALYSSAYPDQLSGGQQQRVGIARAMASAPDLILMDEPFGALDPITRHDIRQDFQAIQREQGFTTVMVTHDLMEAIALGDYICLLDEGLIQQVGTPKEMLFQPANDFVRDFFGQERFQAELEAVALSDIQHYLPDKFSAPEDVENLLTLVKNIPEKNLKYIFEALALYKEDTFA